VDEHRAGAGIDAAIASESVVEDAFDAPDLREMVASSDRTELRASAERVGDRRAFAIVIAQSRRDLAERIGHPGHRGESFRSLGPRRREESIVIDAVEQRGVERPQHPTLKRVPSRAFARAN
jgi:hypothetical protein